MAKSLIVDWSLDGGNWIPYRVCVNVGVIVVIRFTFWKSSLNTSQVCYAFDFYEWGLQDESL
jgi:hypothetical protein